MRHAEVEPTVCFMTVGVKLDASVAADVKGRHSSVWLDAACRADLIVPVVADIGVLARSEPERLPLVVGIPKKHPISPVDDNRGDLVIPVRPHKGDPAWKTPQSEVKTLILEHHMAARRMGFLEMFQALYQVEGLQTGLRDGSLSGLRLFSELVSPVLKARARGDEFAVAAIVRKASPLLGRAAFMAAGSDQRGQLKKAREAVDELMKLWSNDGNPLFRDVLKCIARSNLFEIPEALQPMALRPDVAAEVADGTAAEEYPADPVQMAWESFLDTPFIQIERYASYVSGQATFETHQGVKGREFPRVMVIMDDAEARGFLFNYEKLFAAKEKTKNDLDNERDGKETGIDRTRRLFYVTCSRAQKSLALVAYTSRADKLREYVLREGWLDENEIVVV